MQYHAKEGEKSSIVVNIDDAETSFLNGAKRLGLLGVKGHRSVGGMRASNYNSIPLGGAEKLANFIHDFTKSL